MFLLAILIVFGMLWYFETYKKQTKKRDLDDLNRIRDDASKQPKA